MTLILVGGAAGEGLAEGPPGGPDRRPHGAHGHHGDHGHPGDHGNPADLERYVQMLEAPERATWQKPDEVVRALGVKAGQTVCDIGAGSGYFALRLARVVGAGGRVFAVDVEARLLEGLRQRAREAKLDNLTPVLAQPDDPSLPTAACDLILIVDTWHHLGDGPAYLRRLQSRLRPDGRLVNIDYHKRDLPVGPPVEHKIAREDFLAQAKAAGFELVEEPTLLPHQYFLILRRVGATKGR